MAVASDIRDFLSWGILPADEEDGVADFLDQEPEGLVLPAHEAEQVAECAAACYNVKIRDERRLGLQ